MTADRAVAWGLTVTFDDISGALLNQAHRAVGRLLRCRYRQHTGPVVRQVREGLVTYYGLRCTPTVAGAVAADVATVWTALTGVRSSCRLLRDPDGEGCVPCGRDCIGGSTPPHPPAYSTEDRVRPAPRPTCVQY